MSRTNDAAALLSAHVGMELAAVDVTDEGHIVLSLRMRGRSYRRHVSLLPVDGGIQGTILRTGCRLLTQVAAAKITTGGAA